MAIKASDEFVIGKNDIVWMNDRFTELCADTSFKKKGEGQKYQTLLRAMTDAEIESELKPGICDLADVYTFLKNPPEGTKDGYSNLFYFPACVVGVRWLGYGWYVLTWQRGGHRWGSDGRVFSPATGASVPSNFVPSEPVALSPTEPGTVKRIYRDPNDEKTLYILLVSTGGTQVCELELVKTVGPVTES